MLRQVLKNLWNIYWSGIEIAVMKASPMNIFEEVGF
jgi:hypothetical protein